MDKGNTISTREKMSALIKRYLKYMADQKDTIFELVTLINEGTKIFKDYRKALDMLFYLEALGLLLRVSAEHLVYVGFRGMIRRLLEYESTQKLEQDPREELFIYGKLTSVKQQLLAGQLFANIFYTLIYQKEATTKSSIEEMVDAFVYQQKEFNLKNFVADSLNILSILGFIEKNQATEVITYIGPDFNCYDENQKKISWKVYEVIRREDAILGKEPAELTIDPKIQKTTNSHLPLPAHLSYFPELCFAVLRSQSWEKSIKTTSFFIGRSEKKCTQDKIKTYSIDLELPYKSVSRQHALILYNFQACRWQIRCLSRKNLIKVDEDRFAWGDKNIWLRNRCKLQIGGEKMVFLEVSQPGSD